MASVEDFDALVLAGDRGPDDPVTQFARVPGKVLAPVGGRPMAEHVLDALLGMQGLVRLLVIGPDRAEHRALAERDRSGRAGYRVQSTSPARSVGKGLEDLGWARPVALVTGDHPMLRGDWLRRLSVAAREREADLAVGVAAFADVRAAFPAGRRTAWRFADGAICGTNLFWFQTRAAAKVVRIWQQVEQDRKRPWRIAGLLGITNLVRYLCGRLTLARALERLSIRSGARIIAVHIDDPRSAVDVDSVADLELVRSIMETGNPDRLHVQN